MKNYLSKHKSLHFMLTITLTYLGLFSGNLYGQQIAGWIEQARLEPSGIELKAKMDTGALNSSINAQDIKLFSNDGKEYVRFTVTNKVGDSIELAQPVVRYAKIKRHTGVSQKRPVVELGICISNVFKKVEVNLIDRSGFKYALLIGRSYMSGDFFIDASTMFLLSEPSCEVVRP